MEADSCSNKDNNFLHSWASCETLVDPNEILCSSCTQPTDSRTRLQLLLTCQCGTLHILNIFIFVCIYFCMCIKCAQSDSVSP